MRLSLTILFVLFSSFLLKGQENKDVLNTTILVTKENGTIKNILEEITRNYHISFSYETSEIPLTKEVRLPSKEMLLKEILDVLFKNTEIIYSTRSNVVILKKNPNSKYNPKVKHTISGVIKDAKSGETLVGATIYVSELKIGEVANEYGFYSVTLPEGLYKLRVSTIGYKTFEKDTALTSNVRFDVELSPEATELQEVIVTDKESNLENFQRGISKVDMKTVKELPSLFGESDVLRNILLLPGVSSMAEVGGDFQVRGGSWDQNLMLLDEAPVYNSNHLYGLYSVFNPDIIKDINFYKAGIPANYGGRVSSVMDISQKEGNMKSFHVNGGVGLIASKLAVEGPIVKDKASFIVAARRSTFEGFMKYADNEQASKARPYFYDLNSKVNYSINKNNRIYLSCYLGKDLLEVDKYYQDYGNITATVRYNHIFGEKLFSNTSLIYSNYQMYAKRSNGSIAYKDKLGLKHYEFKSEFIYSLSRHKLDFGMQSIYYTFYPGEQKADGDSSSLAKIKLPNQYAIESAIYIDDKFKIGPKLELQLGIRFSNYSLLGRADIFVYQNDVPRNPIEIIDTIHYPKNKVVQSYNLPEPRISLVYNLTENQTITMSYNQMVQYVQLVSKTFNPLPYDMWKPCNNYIKPLRANQYSIGWFMQLANNVVNVSVESYYKTLRNVIEVKPGTETILNSTLDAGLLQGVGKAYGLEFGIFKTKGKLTGTISYTWSRSLKKIDGKYQEEKINFGNYYSADYDIPHKITFAGEYKLNSRFFLTANFMYQTGRPVTFPVGQYSYFGMLIPYYSEKNQDRYPSYNRLDVGAVLHNKKKEGRKWEGYWTFSLYNLYGRQNVYYEGIRRKDNSQNTEVFKLWFFRIVPSISYNFKF